MQLPKYLQLFESEARAYLKNGLVKDIEFSGGTYQVLVIDEATGEEAWTFLQLDKRGQIKDCFCAFEESEEFVPCAHLCAAFLRIYNGQGSPLHQRFERSLWNKLCRLYADRLGDDPDLLKNISKGNYTCQSVGGKTVFEIETKNAKALTNLKEIIQHRRTDTEETSLKFSNLPQEELMLWREGRPSAQLKYELSFWNDLAKWLMLLQESCEEYTITYGYSTQGLPNTIRISFQQMKMKFYVSEANLPFIIPSLNTVNSSIRVHNDPQEEIEKIIYDKKEGCLIPIPKEYSPHSKVEKKKEKKGISLDGWLFVPQDGFYALDRHKLLSTPKICGKQVPQVLNEHSRLISKLIEGVQLHIDTVQVSYAIAFDTNWNLHLTCYVFSPGDLSFGNSRFFDDWAYLDDDGFYHLEGVRFDNLETIVPQDEVAEFISKHRAWFNTQEGFHTHLASIESQLSYQLSPSNHLSFTRKLTIEAGPGESKDFGPWVYIAGQGFYSKVSSHIGLLLRPGVVLNAEQIPLFIKVNHEELKLVPGFFSDKCPIVKSGLNIGINEEGQVTVTPEYEVTQEYQEKPLRFFDDFVFVEGEGFCELPVDSRLPEKYRHPVVLDKENLEFFLNYELDSLKDYALKIDQRLKKPDTVHLVAASIHKEELEGKDYSVKLKYTTETGSLVATTLWKAIKDKQHYLFSDVGLINLEDRRFDWLRWLDKNQIDRRSHIIHLSTIELIRLNALEELEVQKGRSEESKHSMELLKELTEFKLPEPPDLAGLNSQLRPYQVQGVQWLWFIYCHNLSGLLCDDMGLGKTHQTMALIAAIINHYKKQNHDKPLHFLVVCPTSVIYHWQEKLQAFLPNIRVCTFHGTNRSLDDFHKQYDLLLTSYGIWRMDNDLLSQVDFELAIFDEVQLAKNHNSRVYATLLSAKAKMRLGLTGTPIENHLRELKALFDITLPSYMPSEIDYRELFVKPIEKEGSKNAKQMLSRLIKPFVLRRKKEDVLTDLPDKIEEISHCDLMPEQAKLYNDVLRGTRERLLKELEDESAPVPYVHIFALLSSLKQICNHPAVYLKTPKKYKEYQSGKWELFVELLGEARESQQKVVVYSQYLFMLDIIEDYLNDLGVGFATIRGSTMNRGTQLQRFNQDPTCEVFVASLQAAGLGVDLTAGSVVIHYDRWWNAARENQATDRVHRIGQTRGVQVFKLVTKDTFEERIDELISKKGKLMEEVVGVDDTQVVKLFTRRELIDLLKETEKK